MITIWLWSFKFCGKKYLVQWSKVHVLNKNSLKHLYYTRYKVYWNNFILKLTYWGMLAWQILEWRKVRILSFHHESGLEFTKMVSCQTRCCFWQLTSLSDHLSYHHLNRSAKPKDQHHHLYTILSLFLKI